ncbi:MAG: ABC transporter ATP-binding protein [Acutalibacteraceae bacterium]
MKTQRPSRRATRSALSWIRAVSRRHWPKIALLTVIQTLLSGLGVSYAWLLREMVDHAVGAGKDLDGFRRAAIGLVGLIVLTIGLRAISRYLTELTNASVENSFRRRLFSTLLEREYAAVARVHTGEWMHRLSSDVTVVTEGVCSILPEAVGTLVRLVAAVAVLVYLIPQVMMILLPASAAVILLTLTFRRKLKALHKTIQEAYGRLRVFMLDHLSGLMIVHSFTREEASLRGADERMEEHKKARMRRNFYSNAGNTVFGLIMRGTSVIGAIYCGWRIFNGTMSYGTLTAVMQLIGQVQSPVSNVTRYFPKYYAMLASAERLMEAEAFAPDALRPRIPKEEIRRRYADGLRAMTLRDVSFTYPSRGENEWQQETRVLEHLDLTIGKGEFVAVTGESGCGKSTLLKVLMSLYPLDAGERYLELEGESGAQKEVLDSAWRGLFAYVPQGNQLLSGTIREVVAFGDEEKMADDGALWRALTVACADEFVEKLEKGLDTPLGERGSGLSEGQIQRLAIARAIASDHPVLLLDEATSSLDEATEARLLHNLRSMTDRTVVIVTHRPAALTVCDRQIQMGTV